MNGDVAVPPLRDLPPGRLAQRRDHLLLAIGHERASRGALTRVWPWRGMLGRRRLIVLVAAALVIVVGTASALAVRALFVEGIVGLAPVGAQPSTPVRGALVLDFAFGRTMGDPGRFTLAMYEDGRLIWQRVGDHSRTDEFRNSTGLLERRLTPEGVGLVKAEVTSSGLVDRDLHLYGGRGLFFGQIDLRIGSRRVRVTWGDATWEGVGPDVDRQFATPEQARALVRLDERLEDPMSWLPASAWADPEVKPYVPSGYRVCYQGAKAIGRSRVLDLLPPRAAGVLRGQQSTRNEYTNLLGTFVLWCSDVTNDEARALERMLDDAGVKGFKDVFGLTYGAPDPAASGDPEEFTLMVTPLSPQHPEGGTK